MNYGSRLKLACCFSLLIVIITAPDFSRFFAFKGWLFFSLMLLLMMLFSTMSSFFFETLFLCPYSKLCINKNTIVAVCANFKFAGKKSTTTAQTYFVVLAFPKTRSQWSHEIVARLVIIQRCRMFHHSNFSVLTDKYQYESGDLAMPKVIHVNLLSLNAAECFDHPVWRVMRRTSR